MLLNRILRKSGEVVNSSSIISCEFLEEVNNSTNLTVGNINSSSLDLVFRATDGFIESGEVFSYYQIEDGIETKIGIFTAINPTVITKNTYGLMAYDNVSKLEIVFAEWLRNNQSAFPMTLGELVEAACEYSGVSFASQGFANSEKKVSAFYADNITCRQIVSFAAAIAGMNVVANAEGEIEFSWYRRRTDVEISCVGVSAVTDDGSGNVTINLEDITSEDDGSGNVTITSAALIVSDDGDGNVQIAVDGLTKYIKYFADGLQYENYHTERISRVQLNQAVDDVGVIYPAEADGNCFTITGNLLLAQMETSDVQAIAQFLYEKMCDLTYVPTEVSIPRTMLLRAGDIVDIVDINGNRISTYLMRLTMNGSGVMLESTGDRNYGSNAAVAAEKFSNLSGKLLTIKKDVDGLKIRNEDLEGRITQIYQDTENIILEATQNFIKTGDFEAYQQAVSAQLAVMADNVTISVTESVKQDIADGDNYLQEQIKEITANYRFTADGQYIGKTDSDTMMRLVNDMMQILVANNAATTVDRHGLTADRANIKTLLLGDYTLAVGNDGHLTLS